MMTDELFKPQIPWWQVRRLTRHRNCIEHVRRMERDMGLEHMHDWDYVPICLWWEGTICLLIFVAIIAGITVMMVWLDGSGQS
jgi:hypothetical protein